MILFYRGIVVILLCMGMRIFAQDTLISWDGLKKPVKLIKITETQIKYTNPGDDVIRWQNRSYVAEIKYQNGYSERTPRSGKPESVMGFGAPPSPPPPAPKKRLTDTISLSRHIIAAGIGYGGIPGTDFEGLDYGASYTFSQKHIAYSVGAGKLYFQSPIRTVDNSFLTITAGPAIHRSDLFVSLTSGLGWCHLSAYNNIRSHRFLSYQDMYYGMMLPLELKCFVITPLGLGFGIHAGVSLSGGIYGGGPSFARLCLLYSITRGHRIVSDR